MIKNKIFSKSVALSLMFFSITCSSMSRALFRWCMSEVDSYNPLQLLAGQSFIGAGLLGIFLICRHRNLFPNVAITWQISRALVAVIAYDFLLNSLKLLPLYITTLIGLSTILLTTLASIILFEKKIPHTYLVIGLSSSLFGAVISIKTAGNNFNVASVLYPMIATSLFTISSLLLKKMLLQTDSNDLLQHLFSLIFFMSILLIPAFSSLKGAAVLLSTPAVWLLAMLYLLSQGSYIAAYYYSPLSELSAIKFSKIPLAAALDYGLFSRVLSMADLAATFFILLGIVMSKMGSSNITEHKRKDDNFVRPITTHTKVLS